MNKADTQRLERLFAALRRNRVHADVERIARYVTTHCIGRKSAQTKAEISGKTHVALRRLHDIISLLVRHYHVPICPAYQSPYGHFIATTPEERAAAMRDLEERAKKAFTRRSELAVSSPWPLLAPQQSKLLDTALLPH